MQTYTNFVSRNYRLLFFGFILALFSAFGQTFLISLYVPEIASTFSLSNTEISSMYASATLASAFTLPWIGRYIDIWPLARFATGVIIGMFLALITLSLSINPIMVLVGFWGLRLTGQALMGHTAVTTMARAYIANRGKAISLANIGHPVGEAIFPLAIALLISTYGWRPPLQLSAASLILIVLPLALITLRGADPRILRPKLMLSDNSEGVQELVHRPLRLITSRNFWLLLPGIIFLGAINTAIFFFQIQFGESRGWTISWIAGSIAAFAVASALGMLLSGPWVDRLTARRLFPFFLLPYLVGLLLVALFRFPLIYPIALAFMGFSNGMGSTIINAIYAEIFGTTSIGSVRSIFATVGVFATALGPITFGLLLDNSFSFSLILELSAAMALLVMLWSIQILRSQ